jgi:hypothetical protein
VREALDGANQKHGTRGIFTLPFTLIKKLSLISFIGGTEFTQLILRKPELSLEVSLTDGGDIGQLCNAYGDDFSTPFFVIQQLFIIRRIEFVFFLRHALSYESLHLVDAHHT